MTRRRAFAPGSTNVQVVVATQSGTCPSGFACGGSGSYCAWHSDDDNSVPFTNLPYMLDAGFSCGEDFVSAQDDGFSMVGGHEYAETITDPYPNSGWWDPSDPYGGEIGDKCAWGGSIWGGSDPYGDVNLATGSFAMQSLYSNAEHGCIMSMPQSTDKVTITSSRGAEFLPEQQAEPADPRQVQRRVHAELRRHRPAHRADDRCQHRPDQRPGRGGNRHLRREGHRHRHERQVSNPRRSTGP